MNLIKHIDAYVDGVRVLQLVYRNKDCGINDKPILRVTHNHEQFYKRLYELEKLAEPGARIYASAGARNLKRAAQVFEILQMNARHMGAAAEDQFYEKLNSRWVSALMQPECEVKPRTWLFDFDDDDPIRDDLLIELKAIIENLELEMYAYKTKNGMHILTNAFDRNLMSQDLQTIWKQNALMLWGYA